MSGQPVPHDRRGAGRREAADDRATPADRLTHALRWILVALLVGAAVGAVVLHPKRADFLELRSAVEGGDVTAYGIADEMGWLTVGPLGGSGEPAVVWRDRSGTLRWTDLGTADSVAQSLRPGTETPATGSGWVTPGSGWATPRPICHPSRRTTVQRRASAAVRPGHSPPLPRSAASAMSR
jgi:hypothetical protein